MFRNVRFQNWNRGWQSALVLAVLASVTFAGGPLQVDEPSGTPYVWTGAPATATYNIETGDWVDGDPTQDNAFGVAIVDAAFGAWAGVATSTLTTMKGATLTDPALVAGCAVVAGSPIDVDATNWPCILPDSTDGQSPIVFDDDGTVFEDIFGIGSGVLGVAGPDFITIGAPFEIVEGFAFLNGFALDSSGLSPADLATHEFGHFINLAHTVTNGQIFAVGDESTGPTGDTSFGTPSACSSTMPALGVVETMYPFLGVDCNDSLATPHADDIAALSAIYPSATFASSTGTISGTIFAPDGVTGLTGINVIARNVADPFADSVSAISGDATQGGGPLGLSDGSYTIENLTPGATYNVFIDEILAGGFSTPILSSDPFLAASTVVGDFPGPEEFYNGASESFDDGIDDPLDETGVVVAAGAPVTGIDIIINGTPPVPDPNEPNDTPGTATTLACDTTTTDTSIDPAGDVDWYTLTGTPGDLLTLDILTDNSGSPDTILGAFDSSLASLGFNDDEAFGIFDSLLGVTIPADGIVNIAVSVFGDATPASPAADFDGSPAGSSGPYTLTTTCVTPVVDPNEPNDGFGTATAISCGFSSSSAAIDPVGDVDFFELTGTPGELLSAVIDTPGLSGLDAVLGAFDSSMAELQFSDALPDPAVAVRIPADGTVFLAVSSFDDGDFDGTSDSGTITLTSGGYTLDVTCVAESGPLDPNEPNDSFGTATAISCPTFTTTDAKITEIIDDLDFFTLSGSAGQVINIDIDASELGSTLDSVLGAFDVPDTSIALGVSDDDAAPDDVTPGTDSFLSVTMPADGDMFIAVSSFPDTLFNGGQSTSGPYTMTIVCEECGNGVVEGSEECDDGDTDSGDGCSSTCTIEVCGNGTVDAGEECDDGNTTSGDGCSATCEDECGNGVVDGGEECDDGGNVSGDGCSAVCTAEICGNGVVDAGEDCDDGNTTSGDGCSDMCLNEDPNEPNDSLGAATAISCPGVVTSSTFISPEGDLDFFSLTGTPGVPVNIDIDADELGSTLDSYIGVFDSGGGLIDFNDDGAAPDDVAPGTDSYLDAIPIPADGTLIIGVTSYSDSDFDGIGDLFGIITSGSYTMNVTCVECGNGVVDPGEECDDGNTTSGDGCSVTCTDEPDPPMNVLTNGDFESGRGPWVFYTNGIAFYDDPSGVGRVRITSQGTNVQLFQFNLSLKGGTEYELKFTGRNTGGDNVNTRLIKHTAPYTNYGLNRTFNLTTSNQTFTHRFTTTPGDKTDARFMFWMAPFDMNGNAYFFDNVSIIEVGGCGNGLPDPGEECDDGNAVNGDGCSTSCTLEICGNGTLDAGEECDDGNTVSGDGCDALCMSECGDGVMTPGEECDDGNNVDGDGCSSDCKLEVCGDGVVTGGEECDDGNTASGDGCDSSCLLEDPNEPNEDFAGATPISCPSFTSVNARIGTAVDDLDFYELTGPPGSIINIDIDADELGSTLDSVLGAFDVADNFSPLVLSDDDSAPDDGASGLDSFISVPMPADGDMYIAVSAFPDTAFNGGQFTQGTYTLIVTCEAVCGNGTEEPGEECDDGNTVSGDGCSDICEDEAPDNAVTNGDFAAGTSGWSFYTNGSGNFSTPAGVGRVNIVAPGTNVQLFQSGISVKGSTTYKLTFTARSNTGHNLSVRLLKHTSPYTNYGLSQAVGLTSANQTIELMFTTTPGDKTDARLQFWIAPYDAAGDMYFFDDITLEEM